VSGVPLRKSNSARRSKPRGISIDAQRARGRSAPVDGAAGTGIRTRSVDTRVPEPPRENEIYRQLRAAILDGRLKGGDRLAPTRELASRLSVSRTTVMDIYDRLLSEGFTE
jgi:hypothetical protein